MIYDGPFEYLVAARNGREAQNLVDQRKGLASSAMSRIVGNYKVNLIGDARGTDEPKILQP